MVRIYIIYINEQHCSLPPTHSPIIPTYNPTISPTNTPTITVITQSYTHKYKSKHTSDTPTYNIYSTYIYTYIFAYGLVLEFENVNDRDYNSFIGRYEIKNVNDLLSDNHWWQLLQYDGSHIFYSDDIIFHYQSCKIILVII
eukprot:528927_1